MNKHACWEQHLLKPSQAGRGEDSELGPINQMVDAATAAAAAAAILVNSVPATAYLSAANK